MRDLLTLVVCIIEAIETVCPFIRRLEFKHCQFELTTQEKERKRIACELYPSLTYARCSV